MSVVAVAPHLQPSDLAHLTAEEALAILGYLNLPPVGAFADKDHAPRLGTDEAHELPAALRAAVAERRARAGLRERQDLLGIPGFGPAELGAIAERLSDLTRYGHRLRPVWGGPAADRELFELLESAQRSILICTYVLGGEAGVRLARLLARKRREGVDVRLLFCASGFVISGGPSGTGLISRWSEMRSYLLNDMYVRRRIIAELDEGGVPWRDSAPVGRHWTRRSLRAQGIKDRQGYERWCRDRGVPDAWLDEQERIDRECFFAFGNVDHRKMVVVDGERAFFGSQNLADSYLYKNELHPDPRVNNKNWQWHDSSAILEGGAVRELARLFCMRWALSGGDLFDWTGPAYAPPARRFGDGVVTVVPTLPGMARVPLGKNLGRLAASLAGFDRRPILEGENPVRERLRQLPLLAEKDLYVEQCYPYDHELLASWCATAGRLADFTMIVPRHFDTIVVGYECGRFYPELLKAGVRLAGFRRAIMHTKLAVADSFYTALGSYNLTLRSARADLELNLFIQCPEYGGATRDLMRQDLRECDDIVPSMLNQVRSRMSMPIFDALVRFFIL